MKKKDESEDINETMELLLEVYSAFNELLKQGSIPDKMKALQMLKVMHKKLEERISEYTKSLIETDLDDKELVEKKTKELKNIHNKSAEIKDLMLQTEKLMEKHYPIKTKEIKMRKKRARIKRINSKKIRD